MPRRGVFVLKNEKHLQRLKPKYQTHPRCPHKKEVRVIRTLRCNNSLGPKVREVNSFHRKPQNNNSTAQHSWPYNSSHMLPPMSPHVPSVPCFSPPAYFNQLLPSLPRLLHLCCKIGGNISICYGCHA